MRNYFPPGRIVRSRKKEIFNTRDFTKETKFKRMKKSMKMSFDVFVIEVSIHPEDVALRVSSTKRSCSRSVQGIERAYQRAPGSFKATGFPTESAQDPV